MLESYFEAIEAFLAIYGILAVLGLGVIEELTFFFPTSLLFIAIGFFVVPPSLSLLEALLMALVKIALPGAMGVVIGGLIVYWVCFWGGKKLIKKFGFYFGVTWADIEVLNNRLKKGHIDEAVLTFLRLFPLFPIGLVSVFCGLVRFSRWEFVWTTFFGSLFRLLGLGLLGWYLGREYVKYALQIAAFEHYFVIGFLILLLISLVYFYAKNRRLRIIK